MKPCLFVPFNIRNQIINENCDNSKDISDYPQNEHKQILLSYMPEKKIFNGSVKRQIENLKRLRQLFPSCASIQGSSLNVVNPYRYAVEAFDDSDLKSYWKFNNASGDTPNDSESSADLGTAADLQNTGVTYGATGIIGDALSYDGVDDRSISGSSVSQYNFMFSASYDLTMNFWYKKASASPLTNKGMCYTKAGNDGIALDFIDTGGTGTPSGNIWAFQLKQNGSQIVTTNTTITIPQDTNWHMWSASGNHTDTGIKIQIDYDAEEEDMAEINNPTTSNNANQAMQLANESGSNYWAGLLDEWSIFNRTLSQSEISDLWNGGAGLEIY